MSNRPSTRPPVAPATGIMRQFVTTLIILISLTIAVSFLLVQVPMQSFTARSTIVIVWSGMRPDMVSVTTTPRLLNLGNQGTIALDHHAAFPTTSLVNAAVASTGTNPGSNVYGPTSDGSGQISLTKATDGTGVTSDMPYWVLTDTSSGTMTTTPQPSASTVPTVTPTIPATPTVTPAINLTPTVTITPSATSTAMPVTPVLTSNDLRKLTDVVVQQSLQGQLNGGLIANKTLAQQAIDKGLHVTYEGTGGTALLQTLVPVTSNNNTIAIIDGSFTYPSSLSQQLAQDGVTNPSSTKTLSLAGEYLTQAYIKTLLPTLKATTMPFLSVIQYADPLATAATSGIGSAEMITALQNTDQQLGEIIDALTQLKLQDKVNVIVTSDTGMANVVGPAMNTVTSSTSRTDVAAQMTAAITGNHTGLLPDIGSQGITTTGKVTPVTTVVLALTDGTASISIPSTDAVRTAGKGDISTGRKLITSEIVHWLQQNVSIGPIFVNDGLAGGDGTLPLSTIFLGGTRAPAIVFSFVTQGNAVSNEATNIFHYGGTTYADTDALATNGTFSRRDIHTIFFAAGPSFKVGVRDTAPTGAIDIAPTLREILGLNVQLTKGRALDELLVNGADTVSSIDSLNMNSTIATTANSQIYIEVVQIEKVGNTEYIHNAYGLHSQTPGTLDNLVKNAQDAANQE